MGIPGGTVTINNSTFQNSGLLTYSNGQQTNAADVRTTSASSNYSGCSGGGNVFFSSTTGTYGFSIEGINASNYNSLSLQFGYKKESASLHANFSVDYWNGSSWSTLANTAATLFNEASNASAVWYLAKTLSLPADAQINGLKIRFVKTGSSSLRIDDVKLIGIAQVAPTVVNLNVTAVTTNSATFGGNVTVTGGSIIASTGTVYAVTSTNSNPLMGDAGIVVLNTPNPTSGTGAFSNSSGTVLSPNVQYSYNAFATKSGGAIGYGTAATFYTLAVTPAAPYIANPTSNTVTATIGSDSNSNSTTYAIFETTTSTYLQANGVLGSSAIYQTATAWGNKVITGLTPSTTYAFQTIAKNGAGVTTVAGASTIGTTLVPNSTSSDIIFNTSSSTSDNTNINYSNYQSASITSTVNSVGVMGFYLRDGGATHSDADGLSTELTAISFDVSNWSNIKSARLFVGNSPKGISVPVVSNNIIFTGLTNIIATDNTQLAVSLRVTFNSTVIDNQQIKFTITSATANSIGSQFISANAGGASSSIAGDINRIEVTASKVAFLQQPPVSLYAGTIMTPNPTVAAKDGFDNRDLDYTDVITLTTSGNLNTPLTSTAVAGIATFTYYIIDFFPIGTTTTLTASANNLNAVISNPFEVLESVIPATSIDVPTCSTNNDCNLVPNGDFEQYSQLPNSGSQIENACGWYVGSWSPDYFHSNSPTPFYQIPCNLFGHQTCNGNIGNGYAGISFSGFSNNIISETMVSRLYSPLVAGQSYTLSFDVSLAENYSYFSKNIQAYLSPALITVPPNGPITTSNDPMLLSKTTTSTVTNGWETLSFTFTSTTGEEEYLYLGGLQNVINQPNTVTIDPLCNYGNGQGLSNYSYYYIDNVKLVPTPIQPEFSFSPNLFLCDNSTPPALPTTSDNGVTGTWSPDAINNTLNGNYTFTPDAGQCAASVSLPVYILPDAIVTNNDSFVVNYAISDVVTGSVLANDTFNGNAFSTVPTNLTYTVTQVGIPPTFTNGGIELNANGTYTIQPNTPNGTYTFYYTITTDCGPSNTSSVTITVIDVYHPGKLEFFFCFNATGSQYNSLSNSIYTSLFDLGTVAGAPASMSNATIMPLTAPTPSAPITINADGTFIISPTIAIPGVATADYSFTYRICSSLTGLCSNDIICHIVIKNSVQAIPDVVVFYEDIDPIPSINALANDIKWDCENALSATSSNVIVTPLAPFNSFFSIDSNGIVSSNITAPVGIYPIQYQICDAAFQNNCSISHVLVYQCNSHAPCIIDKMNPSSTIQEFDIATLVIAPNPSHGNFEMLFDTETPKDMVYEVYDMLGKQLLSNRISKGLKNCFVNLEGYPEGIYLLRVSMGDAIVNKKLIKN